MTDKCDACKECFPADDEFCVEQRRKRGISMDDDGNTPAPPDPRDAQISALKGELESLKAAQKPADPPKADDGIEIALTPKAFGDAGREALLRRQAEPPRVPEDMPVIKPVYNHELGKWIIHRENGVANNISITGNKFVPLAAYQALQSRNAELERQVQEARADGEAMREICQAAQDVCQDPNSPPNITELRRVGKKSGLDFYKQNSPGSSLLAELDQAKAERDDAEAAVLKIALATGKFAAEMRPREAVLLSDKAVEAVEETRRELERVKGELEAERELAKEFDNKKRDIIIALESGWWTVWGWAGHHWDALDDLECAIASLTGETGQKVNQRLSQKHKKFGRTKQSHDQHNERQRVWGMLDKAQTKANELTVWCDLMVDEFTRIKVRDDATKEIIGLCERAITNTKQHIPVIEQRDKAESALSLSESARAAAEERAGKLAGLVHEAYMEGRRHMASCYQIPAGYRYGCTWETSESKKQLDAITEAQP